MSRSDQVYLQDILESLEIILTYTENKTEFEFINDLHATRCSYKKIRNYR